MTGHDEAKPVSRVSQIVLGPRTDDHSSGGIRLHARYSFPLVVVKGGGGQTT